MDRSSLIADTIEFVVFGWILLIHGIAVLIPSVFFGLFIFGFQIMQAVYFGIYITLLSLAFSTPAMVYGLLKNPDSDGFLSHYIFYGYPVGAGILIFTAVGLSFYRIWLFFTGFPQPNMPSALSGAIGVAIIAVTLAFVVGIVAGNRSKKPQLQSV